MKPLNYPFVMSVVGILPHNIKRGLLMIMKNLENLVFSWHAWPEIFIILILYRHILYFLYWHSFFQRNKESLFFLLELKHSLDLTQLFIFHLKKSYYCSRLAPVHENFRPFYSFSNMHELVRYQRMILHALLQDVSISLKKDV